MELTSWTNMWTVLYVIIQLLLMIGSVSSVSPFQGEVLKVSTLLQTPYLEQIPDKATGNDTFYGYTKDILDKMSKYGLQYEFVLATNNMYGAKLPDGGWTGAVGDVVNGSVDFAAGPITVTASRAKVVDFSQPFQFVGPVIVMRRPIDIRPPVADRLSYILVPFQSSVWWLTILAFFVTASVIYVISYVNPYEWRRMSYEGEATIREGESFTCVNSFWFALGAFALQGFLRTPRSMGGRIAVCFWWFFALVFVSCYIANLSNMLRLGPNPNELTEYSKVRNFYDLSRYSDIKIIIIGRSATEEFFRTSEQTEHQKIFRHYQKNGISVDNFEDGVNIVKSKYPGTHVFLMESNMAKYYTKREECKLYMINSNLATRQYGFVMPFNSKYQKALDFALIELQEEGVLQSVEKKWFDGHCTKTTLKISDSDTYELSLFYPLGLGSFSGALFILTLGLLFAGIVTFVEYLIYKYAESETSSLDGKSPPRSPTRAADGQSGSNAQHTLLVPDNTDKKEVTTV